MAREILRFFAVAARGTEELVQAEVEAAGGTDLQVGPSGVAFRGPLEAAYRLCLHARVTIRVVMPMKSFEAHTPEHLYEGVRRVRWSRHLQAHGTFAVDFTSVRSAISHTHFGALKVKDAIVDQFRDETGERPSIDRVHPDVRVSVHLDRNQAQVSLDLSGESLHRRGYREEGARAPLKETLAAAILLHAEWPRIAAEGGEFLDPMCGSGTLPIEAALIAARRAPGLDRNYFGFLRWEQHDAELWRRLVEEAQDLEIRDPKKIPRVWGFDRDFRAVRTAIDNVERAGLRAQIHIEKREMVDTVRPAEKGLIGLNPPYGERLGEVEELKPVYRAIGDLFKQRFQGWQGFVFTGNQDLSKEVGLKAFRRVPLFNGPIECRLLRYDIY